jgi:hypothetical protein
MVRKSLQRRQNEASGLRSLSQEVRFTPKKTGGLGWAEKILQQGCGLSFLISTHGGTKEELQRQVKAPDGRAAITKSNLPGNGIAARLLRTCTLVPPFNGWSSSPIPTA